MIKNMITRRGDASSAAERLDLLVVLEVVFTTLLVAVLLLVGGAALFALYKLFSDQSQGPL